MSVEFTYLFNQIVFDYCRNHSISFGYDEYFENLVIVKIRIY